MSVDAQYFFKDIDLLVDEFQILLANSITLLHYIYIYIQCDINRHAIYSNDAQ